MPQQIFQVLRCYTCQVFQVHQCKKAIKWECKMCGEKQSIKRNYGIGTSKDCRGHVQRLNGIRAEIDETKNAEDADEEEEVSYPKNITNTSTTKIIESKWKNYVEEINENTTFEPVPNNTMYHNGTEVVLEIPKKQPQKKLNKHSYNHKKKPSKYNRQYNDSSDASDLETEVSTNCVKPIEKARVKYIPPTRKSNSNLDFTEVARTETEKVIDTPFKLKINKVIIDKDTKLHKYKKQKIIDTPVIQCNSKWASYIDDNQRDEQEICDEENKQLCISSGGDSQNLDSEEVLINAHDDDIIKYGFNIKHRTVKISTDETYKPYNIDSLDLRNFTEANNFLNKEGTSNKENLQNIFSLCDDKDLDDVLSF